MRPFPSLSNLDFYRTLPILIYFNYLSLSHGESVGHCNPTNIFEVSSTNDFRECSWCVKQMIKEIVSKAKDALQENDVGVEEGEVELRVRLTSKELQLLDEFGQDDSWIRLEQVLQLLQPSYHSPHLDDKLHQLHRNGLSPAKIIVISTGGLTLCAMWMILSRRSICLVVSLLVILSFSVGISWNWWKLYNEEYSRRVTQIPDECKPDQASWYHSFKGFIVDPNCGEYFKAPVDDPVAMVSPQVVITETLSMLFVSPISLVMSSFAGFIQSLCGNFVWPLNWIVQILLTLFFLAAGTIIIITVLAGMFNLDLKFSTFLLNGELKPSRINKERSHQQSQAPRLKEKSYQPPRRVPRPENLALFPSPPSPFR